MFRFIQTFSVTGKFTERYHIFCARIDLLFTIFVYSRYILWATIRLLHHFGFVMCVNSRLYCTHFSCHWRKIRNVSRRLTQISKRQRDPCWLEWTTASVQCKHMCVGIIVLYCTHFSCHWCKIRNGSRRLTQISKRQRDPCRLEWTTASVQCKHMCVGIIVLFVCLAFSALMIRNIWY